MSETTDKPDLAELFRDEDGKTVVISASGRVCPMQCGMCVSFHRPKNPEKAWGRRLPPALFHNGEYLWVDASMATPKEMGSTKHKFLYYGDERTWPQRIWTEVLNQYGECRASEGKNAPFTMTQGHPELKHQTEDFCTKGELRESVVREKMAQVAARRRSGGQG